MSEKTESAVNALTEMGIKILLTASRMDPVLKNRELAIFTGPDGLGTFTAGALDGLVMHALPPNQMTSGRSHMSKWHKAGNRVSSVALSYTEASQGAKVVGSFRGTPSGSSQTAIETIIEMVGKRKPIAQQAIIRLGSIARNGTFKQEALLTLSPTILTRNPEETGIDAGIVPFAEELTCIVAGLCTRRNVDIQR